MELSIRVEESVHRVATQSSTKNCLLERKVRRDRCRIRSSRLEGLNESSSDFSFSPESTIQLDPVIPIALVEKGVEANRISKDISREVGEELEESGQTPCRTPCKCLFFIHSSQWRKPHESL